MAQAYFLKEKAMKLIKVDNYELKVADEALLVKPIRKLFNQDRSKGKESFYKQMSILYFVYDPSSNYSYIVNDKERLNEVLAQEGIMDFKMTPEFKDAVEAYKKLTVTPSSIFLEDIQMVMDKMRKALKNIDFESLDEKDMVNAIKTVTAVVSATPKLTKDLAAARKAVEKEREEQTSARGTQELSVGDLWAEQGI